MAMMSSIILASTSPYRRMLLDRLHLAYESVNPLVEEINPGLPLEQLGAYLAEKKAQAVFERHPEAICIGADQVLVADHTFYEKPNSLEKNKVQLRQLSGKEAKFYTGLCVISKNHTIISTTITSVYFRHLSDTMIENYLNKEPSPDCAGGFKSEGLGIALLSRIETHDPTALIGLPLIALIDALGACGVDLL